LSNLGIRKFIALVCTLGSELGLVFWGGLAPEVAAKYIAFAGIGYFAGNALAKLAGTIKK